ncbi:hypothetical protein [Pedobacter gandavensis]|uniref:Uncharacterized protein n=1 Tax=Pedobacter gandavensis TaxID=2679963 RepID=A0ABR6EXF3_9SPHI|nr:hypothetical protein [Pedobacter gandavensis]MBB2149656.1 hypothetical protein [Pedobacter gandavensis]
MGSELTTNGAALRLFFTEDIYLIKGEEGYSTEEALGSVVQEDSAGFIGAEEESLSLAAEENTQIPQVTNPATVTASPVVPAIPTIPQPISIPVLAAAAEKPAALSFTFLGKNKKKILILVNDATHEVSDEAGRELLRKIVKSINLTASDFALLNYANYPKASFTELQQYFSSGLIFAFGVSAADLKLATQPENKIVMEGDVRLIFSAELRKLEQDPAGKKALWGSLKQLGL